MTIVGELLPLPAMPPCQQHLIAMTISVTTTGSRSPRSRPQSLVSLLTTNIQMSKLLQVPQRTEMFPCATVPFFLNLMFARADCVSFVRRSNNSPPPNGIELLAQHNLGGRLPD